MKPTPQPKSEGQRRLRELPGSLAAIAGELGCSRQLVGYWKKGTKRPGTAHRSGIEKAFGIPAAAWEQAPATPKAKRPKRRASRSVDTAGAVEMSTLDEVKADLRRLREIDTSEYTVADGLKVSAQRTQLLALKARLERDQEQFEDRVIRKSRWWIRFEAVFVEALKSHPDAARDVAEALAGLESA